ncbi:MAG: iron-containing alcohol dehydrogenase [Anaerolineae bacterium]
MKQWLNSTTVRSRNHLCESGSLARLGSRLAALAGNAAALHQPLPPASEGHIAAIEAALGARLVARYMSVPDRTCSIFNWPRALQMAVELGLTPLIGLGGGSPIGLAKAVSSALEEQRTGRPARAAFPTEQPLIPVIAIPTTYAGSEMTPIYGVTHHADGSTRKITVRDAKIAPKLVIYDPTLTLNLPPALTAGTGINALAHCVEAVYSITRNPFSSAAALSGIQYINWALPLCYRQGDDLPARTDMLLGAHLAGTSLASVAMGLHHGLCHVLGGSAGVAHGVANAIILPHAMRFNLDACAPQLAQVAQAMGVTMPTQSDKSKAEAAIQAVERLIGQWGCPSSLREAGVAEAIYLVWLNWPSKAAPCSRSQASHR